MPGRTSHRKSRLGCLTCKARRVKCDEQGPPCGNCKARATNCQYPSLDRSPQPSTASSNLPTITLHPGSDGSTPIPTTSRQLLELRLMHRWSTVTYETLSASFLEDAPIWQLAIPEAAYDHEFLLHGIFAMSAFDLARSCKADQARHISTALEYQDLAFRGFRAQLREPTSDSYEALLYFSILLVPLDLASAQFVTTGGEIDSKIHHTIVQYELSRGAALLVISKPDVISTHPLFRKVVKISDLPRVPLEAGTEVALGKLFELNERRSLSSLGDSCKSQEDRTLYLGCKKALCWLSECFATCLQAPYQGYCLQWIVAAGDDYYTAMKKKDLVALLILAYWAILVENLGLDYWWVGSFGKTLIDEISQEITDDADETTKGMLLWAQGQVEEIAGISADY